MTDKKDKKGMTELKKEIEDLSISVEELTTNNSSLVNSANQLAGQLNSYMGLCSQYETTINLLSGRIKDKDNVIAQLNQKMQTGGE
tara:strand:+ start:3154 stop:3411 length:258 start_codon:yes stop_codon:yes gene_type:complete